MKITKIVKRLGRVINKPGEYSSIRIEAEAEATLGKDDSVESVDKELFDVLSKMLLSDLKRIREKQAEKSS